MDYSIGSHVIIQSGMLRTYDGRLESEHPHLRIEPIGSVIITDTCGEDLIVKATSALLHFDDGLAETSVRFSNILLRVRNAVLKLDEHATDVQQAA